MVSVLKVSSVWFRVQRNQFIELSDLVLHVSMKLKEAKG